MATYNPKRKTTGGMEEIKFPLSAIADNSVLQRAQDNLLETASKTIVGAINEINAKLPTEGVVGTWVFNDTITNFATSEATTVVLKFLSYDPYNFNGGSYTSIVFGITYTDEVTGANYVARMTYNRSGPSGGGYNFETNIWYNEGDKTITITEQPTDIAFIAWLKANATKQPDEPAITTLQTPITYSELKSLRDNAELITGMFYRITDYKCTTIQDGSRALDHKFDIIVQALSTNALSEDAKADHHYDEDGNKDEYFAECNLAAWEIKYCIDNDSERFSWVSEEAIAIEWSHGMGDTLVRQPDFDGVEEVFYPYVYAWGTFEDAVDGDPANFVYSINPTVEDGELVLDGSYVELVVAKLACKGVIYYMKDDNDISCGYDFKNIQFRRYKALTSEYTYENGVQRPLILSLNGYFNNEESNDFAVDLVDRLDEYFAENAIISAYSTWMSGLNPPKARDLIDAGDALADYLIRLSEIQNNLDALVAQIGYDTVENAPFAIVLLDPTPQWFYTFSNGDFDGETYEYSSVVDGTLYGNFSDITMHRAGFDGWTYFLPDNVFLEYSEAIVLDLCDSNTFYSASSIVADASYNNTICCAWGVKMEGCTNSYVAANSSTIRGHQNTFLGGYNVSLHYDCSYNFITHDAENIIFNENCYENKLNGYSNLITFGHGCQNNYVGSECYQTEFGYDCYGCVIRYCSNNVIGDGCQFIYIHDDCNYNTVGGGCFDISFYDSCINNVVGSNCRACVLDSWCVQNTLKGSDQDCYLDTAYNNTIGYDCILIEANGDSNTVGNNCEEVCFNGGSGNNKIGDSCVYILLQDAYYNTVEGECSDIVFDKSSYNRVGAGCSTISLREGCSDNKFDNGCSEISTGEYWYGNSFGVGCNNIAFNGYDQDYPPNEVHDLTIEGGCEALQINMGDSNNSAKQTGAVLIKSGVRDAAFTVRGSSPKVYSSEPIEYIVV